MASTYGSTMCRRLARTGDLSWALQLAGPQEIAVIGGRDVTADETTVQFVKGGARARFEMFVAPACQASQRTASSIPLWSSVPHAVVPAP